MSRASLVLAAFTAACCLGCGQNPPPVAAEPQVQTNQGSELPADAENAKTPAEKLHAQLRAGSVQVQGLLSGLEEADGLARELLKAAAPSQKEAIQEISSAIDAVGEAISDSAMEAPDRTQVESDLIKHHKLVADIRASLEGAWEDMNGGANIAESVAESDAALRPLSRVLRSLAADLKEAILTYGGKVPEEEPVS